LRRDAELLTEIPALAQSLIVDLRDVSADVEARAGSRLGGWRLGARRST
jgi:hypothetical protein